MSSSDKTTLKVPNTSCSLTIILIHLRLEVQNLLIRTDGGSIFVKFALICFVCFECQENNPNQIVHAEKSCNDVTQMYNVRKGVSNIIITRRLCVQ